MFFQGLLSTTTPYIALAVIYMIGIFPCLLMNCNWFKPSVQENAVEVSGIVTAGANEIQSTSINSIDYNSCSYFVDKISDTSFNIDTSINAACLFETIIVLPDIGFMPLLKPRFWPVATSRPPPFASTSTFIKLC